MFKDSSGRMNNQSTVTPAQYCLGFAPWHSHLVDVAEDSCHLLVGGAFGPEYWTCMVHGTPTKSLALCRASGWVVVERRGQLAINDPASSEIRSAFMVVQSRLCNGDTISGVTTPMTHGLTIFVFISPTSSLGHRQNTIAHS
jgi:hypothetical protein